MEGFYMSANIIRLLPDEERALLECYVAGSQHPPSFQQLFDTMEVPTDAVPDRLQIVVAQILLHHVQDGLPQWASTTNDGMLVTNRKRHKRHKDARLYFTPRLLFEINWATSGPGFEWPEAYHVTYVPGLEKYIFTASRDGADALGCEDHAIGAADRTDDLQRAAKKVLTSYWRHQVDEWGQGRWESCIQEGLIDDRTANAWAEAVWHRRGRIPHRRCDNACTVRRPGKTSVLS
jgi:hypothetical protein